MINEHIKEIGTRAGLYMEEHYQGGFPNDAALVAEDFALLIIKECIEQCKQHYAGSVHTQAGVNNKAVMKCINSIKDHFGVK